MSIDRTEYWTAAGVVVAALVGGSAFGYYFGKDSASSKVESLEQLISMNKSTSQMDAPAFLERVKVLETSMGQKEKLLKENADLSSSLKQKSNEIEAHVLDLENGKERISSLEDEVKKLNALIKKDYSVLNDFIVKQGEATWAIPNEVAVSMRQSSRSSAYITVTDTLSGDWVDLGERVTLKNGKENCSIIPTEFVPSGLLFSLICKQVE